LFYIEKLVQHTIFFDYTFNCKTEDILLPGIFAPNFVERYCFILLFYVIVLCCSVIRFEAFINEKDNKPVLDVDSPGYEINDNKKERNDNKK